MKPLALLLLWATSSTAVPTAVPMAAGMTNRTHLHEQFVLNSRDGGNGALNDQIIGTARVGDGDPHQAYRYTQVTSTITCAPDEQEGCSISRQDAKYYAVQFSGGISALWINAGFAVTQTTATGQTGTCNGGAGDTICVWYRTAHTAYTVQKYAYYWRFQQVQDGTKVDAPYVIWSPNANGVGDGYVCALNKDCWNQGGVWWGKSGPAGGPQLYPGNTPWL
ncbi:hypothetical protein VHEMI10696 [[Torrubiella] hemipterigena]|uniref:Uncharacterized protein n=1 Tax=[Torrubiella] hemipterigena TaxID=1531966 RepID=A0A0A1TDY5_9HYPO|nr:hypothetical protein VHEMI10696 [[Torrubiella] hemipterigena]